MVVNLWVRSPLASDHLREIVFCICLFILVPLWLCAAMTSLYTHQIRMQELFVYIFSARVAA
jgi:hypothetical protein